MDCDVGFISRYFYTTGGEHGAGSDRVVLEGNHANVISTNKGTFVGSDRGYWGQGMAARKKAREQKQTRGKEETAAIVDVSIHYSLLQRKLATGLPQQVSRSGR